MLRDLQKNNHGVVFVTVLIIIIVSMILAMSVVSLNVSQIKSVEAEIQYIQAKALAEGALSNMFITRTLNEDMNTFIGSETVGSTTFTLIGQIDTSGTGPIGLNCVPMYVNASY